MSIFKKFMDGIGDATGFSDYSYVKNNFKALIGADLKREEYNALVEKPRLLMAFSFYEYVTEPEYKTAHIAMACDVLSDMTKNGAKFSDKRVEEFSKGLKKITNQPDTAEPLAAYLQVRKKLAI